MICHEHNQRRWVARASAAAAAAVLMIAIPLADTAAAHGSAIGPASRNYGCWKRWGSDFQNPEMKTKDPMCWQAWQADVNAMWNWNGLYREGVAGNHQGTVLPAKWRGLYLPGSQPAISRSALKSRVHLRARRRPEP